MAIAFVQSHSKDHGSVSTGTEAFTSNVTAGSTLIAFIRVGAGTTCTFSDDHSNTWAQIDSKGTTGDGTLGILAYAKNAAAGATTVSFALSGTVTLRSAIHEYSGLDTSAPLDQHNSSANVNTVNVVSGNVTTGTADELLFGALVCENLNSPASFVAGLTNKREQLVVGGLLKIGTEDQIVSSTGTYSATATLNTSDHNVGFIATFKAGGAAAAQVPYQSYYQTIVTQ